MTVQQYEIEIKSLLGSEENANNLIQKMQSIDPSTKLVSKSSQLNHYFVGGDGEKICIALTSHIAKKKIEAFKKVLNEGNNLSLRTRQANKKVLFVAKASIDDTTSSNGTARIEFEAEIPELSLEALDRVLLEAGCTYQAKWSRDRREYIFQDTTACIDRNAGYGYVVELEKIVTDGTSAEQVKRDLRTLMETLGIEELSQDRLERMFAYYNEHWSEYYGTDKTFTIS
ncbi:MAG: CYTH domain-containing protein [Candidatus Moranbacteria bacterium]|nr:CYTH domain-containing protein [Candidatus Moranbacteria bacterium]MDD3965381.1 CYTH domain-containing protein [Candidatus Moranbacteria bacterium]